MQWNHRNWMCPFYLSDEKSKVHCEGATVHFHDKDLQMKIINLYCCDAKNYAKCSIARELINLYEEGNNE